MLELSMEIKMNKFANDSSYLAILPLYFFG